MKPKKCELCFKDAKKGQRLCSMHYGRYSRRDKNDFPTLDTFIIFHKKNPNYKKPKSSKIVESTTKSQKKTRSSKKTSEVEKKVLENGLTHESLENMSEEELLNLDLASVDLDNVPKSDIFADPAIFKIFFEALRNQEQAKKAAFQNERELGNIIDRSEAYMVCGNYLNHLYDFLEKRTDVWPDLFAKKSASQIRKIMVTEVQQVKDKIIEYLEAMG